MKLEFLRDWRVYQKGQITDKVDFGVSVELVRNGIAAWFKDPGKPEQLEKAEVKRSKK